VDDSEDTRGTKVGEEGIESDLGVKGGEFVAESNDRASSLRLETGPGGTKSGGGGDFSTAKPFFEVGN